MDVCPRVYDQFKPSETKICAAENSRIEESTILVVKDRHPLPEFRTYAVTEKHLRTVDATLPASSKFQKHGN